MTETERTAENQPEVEPAVEEEAPLRVMGGRRDVRNAQSMQFMTIGPRNTDLLRRAEPMRQRLYAYEALHQSLQDTPEYDAYWDLCFLYEEMVDGLRHEAADVGTTAAASGLRLNQFDQVENGLRRLQGRYGEPAEQPTGVHQGSGPSAVGVVADVVSAGDTAVGALNLTVAAAAEFLFAAGAIAAFLYTAFGELDAAWETGERMSCARGIAYGAVHAARGSSAGAGSEHYDGGVATGRGLYDALEGDQRRAFNRWAAEDPAALLNSVYQEAVHETMSSRFFGFRVGNVGRALAEDRVLSWPR